MNTALILTFLLCVGILLALFLLGRALSLWYFKIDERVKRLEAIQAATDKQAEILTQQLEIMQMMLYKSGISKIMVKNNLTGEMFSVEISDWQTGGYDKKRYTVINAG